MLKFMKLVFKSASITILIFCSRGMSLIKNECFILRCAAGNWERGPFLEESDHKNKTSACIVFISNLDKNIL